MRRHVFRLAMGVAGAMLLVVAAIFALDTQPGRDLALRQIERLIAPDSGLRIRADRIEGSLYGKLVIHGLEVSDPKGVFLTAPTVRLDWRPARFAWDDRLEIASLVAPRARLHRLPELRRSVKERPLLPEFDVDIGRFEIGTLAVDEAVAGRPQRVRLAGSALIEDGRADVRLDAQSRPGGDRIRVSLGAEPEADRFDLAAEIDAPAGGLLAGLTGLRQAFEAGITGEGTWSRWRGRVEARLAEPDARLASLDVTAAGGRFRARGHLAPGAAVGGLAARLLPEGIAVDLKAAPAGEDIGFVVNAAAPAVRMRAEGRLDPERSALADTTAAIRLLQPSALIRTLSGRGLAVDLELAGPLSGPTIDYRFTADWFALGNQRIHGPVATGRAAPPELDRDIEFAMTFDRLSGAGDLVERLTRDARLTGKLDIDGLRVRAPSLAIRSDYLTGTAAAVLDLETGRYDVRSNVRLTRYPVPGLGLASAAGRLHLFPHPTERRKLVIEGPVNARLERLDNEFLRFVFGGLPRASANIRRRADGNVELDGVRLTAPDLKLSGEGEYRLGEQIAFEGAGTQRRLGPLSLALSGNIARPAADLLVESYFAGVDVDAIRARFTPAPTHYAFAARGQSMLGPVEASGTIDTGGEVAYRIDRLSVAGIAGKGVLRPAGGVPVAGALALSGEGIDGRAEFTPEGDVQRIDIVLAARNGTLATPLPVSIRRGQANARIRLAEGRDTALAASANLAGVAAGKLMLAEAAGTASLIGGEGEVGVELTGRGGRPYQLDIAADIGAEEIRLAMDGRVGRGRISLPSPARIRREPAGVRLLPVQLDLPQGSAMLSGRYGKGLAMNAKLDDAGLGIVGLALPWADFRGRASGTVALAVANDGMPQGEARLRLTDFSRISGAAGEPIDIGLAARLDADGGALRAAFADGERALGRLQLRLLSIAPPAAGGWSQRLLASPIAGQLRYDGPAQSLWPLTGIEAVAIGGPIDAAVSARGTLGDPQLTGQVASSDLRFESVASGTVIDGIELAGRFAGSELRLERFQGSDPEGGGVEGRGTIDLSFVRGFPIDLRLELDNAELIDIDTLDARVSGPLSITSNSETGARIAGDLQIGRTRYRPSRDTESVVPVLAVREVNTELLRRPQRASEPTVWQLDVGAVGDDRVYVRGLGLDSEWTARLELGGVVGAPRLTGTAELIRGDYDFAGRRFELTRGEVSFQGEYPPDPVLNIAAEARVEGLTAIISIQGLSSAPEVSFTSIPSLPQDEIMSRVLFGTTIAKLSAAEAVQLAGAVAALREGGDAFDPVGAVRRAVGVDRLRILDNQADGQGPGIAAGEYLGRRTYVELATDTEGHTVTQIEYALTRALSILGRIATLGGSSVGVRISKDY